MVARYPKNTLIDTGYWYAIFDDKDRYHTRALAQEDLLESVNILIPWPSLYECLKTKFVKNRVWIQRFNAYIKKPTITLVRDTLYRENALDLTLKEAIEGHRHISLVDMVIRLMLEDVSLNVHSLITYNEKDFSDICKKQQIEIL